MVLKSFLHFSYDEFPDICLATIEKVLLGQHWRCSGTKTDGSDLWVCLGGFTESFS